MNRLAWALAGLMTLCCRLAGAAELVIADFNAAAGMHWTWDAFQWTAAGNSVRIYDPANSTGGAGRSTPGLNLSSYASGRFVFDMTVNPTNGSNFFTMALEDAAGRRNWWNMSVSSLSPGTPARLVSHGTLSNPTGGEDVANFDLGQIAFFQIDGEWANPNPFDMSFDKIAVSTSVAAPPPYPGHEPDAPWRAEAAARIDAIRKAPLTLRVVDAAGHPLPNATVSVHMKQHEFGFGSAVNGVRLRDNNPVHAMYKQKVAELFNIVTLENDLKWPAWIGEWGSSFTQQGALNAVSWLEARDIDVRGHNVIWPGRNNLPTPVKQILDAAPLDAVEQAALRGVINDHIDDIVGRFSGRLAAWDVVNEPWDNHDVMDNLPEGNAAMIDWFQLTRDHDPAAKLYLNDYNILSTGGATNTPKQQFYYDTAKMLIDSGAPIDGIGFQGHFNEDSLAGPQQLWTILDRFAQLGLDMQVTEFDVGTDDEQLQADFTRDFLTAMFAHQGINTVSSWGFWEGAHFDPRRAMYRSDWSIKPNGQAFVDLVFNQWWTDEQLSTDLNGIAALRGFKGDYEVVVTYEGETIVVPMELTDGGLALEVALPLLAADFDGDGGVDAEDLTQWQSDFGLSANSDADGDLDSDGADFLAWQRQLGRSVTSLGDALGASSKQLPARSPEPSMLVLAAFSWVGLTCGMRRLRLAVETSPR